MPANTIQAKSLLYQRVAFKTAARVLQDADFVGPASHPFKRYAHTANLQNQSQKSVPQKARNGWMLTTDDRCDRFAANSEQS
jgi:hypothetical protein